MSSLTMKKIDVVGLVDPRINTDQKVAYTVMHCSQNVKYQRTAFQSYGTSGNWSMSVNIPSTQTIVDRVCYMECDMTFTFAGADQGQPLVVPGDGFDALRDMPFQSCVTSSSVNLGNISFTESLSKTIHEKRRSCDQKLDRHQMSSAPSMQDFYQDYADSVTYGDAVNPLASIGASSMGASRGGYRYTIVSQSNTQTVVNVKWLEPLLCAPFSLPQNYAVEKGFVGLNSLQMDFNMKSLTNMWSHSASGRTLSSITVAFNNPPALINTFLDQNPLVENVPKLISYNVPEVSTYQSNSIALASGASSNFSIPSIRLNAVPDLILVCCREIEANKTYLSSDSYCEITNLSINWGNRSSLLNEATQAMLYQIAIKNGLDMTFAQWQEYTGSCVLIRPDDLGLPLNVVSGSLSATQIQIDATCRNLSASNRTYELAMLVFNNTVLTKMADNTMIKMNGVLSEKDVINAKIDQSIQLEELKTEGNGFFSSVGKLAKTGWKYRKPLTVAAKVAKKGYDLYSGSGMVDKGDLDKNLKSYIRRR